MVICRALISHHLGNLILGSSCKHACRGETFDMELSSDHNPHISFVIIIVWMNSALKVRCLLFVHEEELHFRERHFSLQAWIS